ncbi:MAG TPA: sporulation protein YabP [Tissierellaceae bacterium]|nr:sporulation protein YabP [Tissierellaceae bacterium]
MENTRKTFIKHNIVIEDRNRVKISGVEHVDSYNDTSISLFTIKGKLSIKGEELNISKLNLDDGSIRISGTIDSLIYTGKEGEPRNLLGKIFK